MSNTETGHPRVPVVSAAETHALVRDGAAIYLDVRTPEEFAEGHAPGAVNVPVALAGSAGPHAHDKLEPNELFVAQVKSQLSEGSQLILACGAGRRASRAAVLLESAGFSNLRLFKDGWTGWKATGLPQEGGARGS